MFFLRSLLFFIGSTLMLIIITSLVLILFFLPLRKRYIITSQWAKFNIWWLGLTTGLYYKVHGLENILKTPCVILSNHQSTWESLVFQLIFPQQIWVLKKQLLFIPIFGWGLALLNPIIINREKKIQALRVINKQGIARLKQGLWIVIFPEGTRQGVQVGHYQAGGAMIAKAANSPILPVYHNSGKYWRKGQFIKQKGIINVVIGKPINPDNKTAKALTLEVEKWAKEQEIIINKIKKI